MARQSPHTYENRDALLEAIQDILGGLGLIETGWGFSHEPVLVFPANAKRQSSNSQPSLRPPVDTV